MTCGRLHPLGHPWRPIPELPSRRKRWLAALGFGRRAEVDDYRPRRPGSDPVRTFAGGMMMVWNTEVCLDCLDYASNGGLETCRTAAEAVARDHRMSYTQEELNEAVNNLLAHYHANGHTFRSADV